MSLRLLLLPVFFAPAVGLAQIQVVGDGACPKFAVDIAAFATCDGDRVTSPVQEAPLAIAAMPATAVSPSKQTEHGLYVSAAEAYRLRQAYPGRVVLIDIRSSIEASYTGQPDLVDIQVPYLLEPQVGAQARGSVRLRRNPDFVEQIKAALAQLDGPSSPAILLLCRSGQRSAIAADALGAAGLGHVYTIVDGFEGDIGPSGRRDVNGWKNAGAPWQARSTARMTAAAY